MDDTTETKTTESVLVTPRQVVILFSSLLLVWLIQMLIQAAQWPTTEDRFFPLLVGIPTLVLLIIHIGRNILSDQSVEESDPEEMSSGATAISKREISLSVIVIGFMILIYYTGFIISMPVFLFGMIFYLTGNPRKSIISTLLILALIYVLFVEILNMTMWHGTLELLSS